MEFFGERSCVDRMGQDRTGGWGRRRRSFGVSAFGVQML